jgi:hypothetical protein
MRIRAVVTAPAFEIVKNRFKQDLVAWERISKVRKPLQITLAESPRQNPDGNNLCR